MNSDSPEYHRDILKHDVEKFGVLERNGIDGGIWIKCHDCDAKWNVPRRHSVDVNGNCNMGCC